MAAGYPKLNFPPIKLRATRQGEALMVWNEIRRCQIQLTPEEWVRRHLVGYLLTECGVERSCIAEEYPVEINGLNQRADVVVMDSDGRPLLLAECKAPEVKISQQTLSQAGRYNAVVGARYLLLTNGLQHFSYELTPQGYLALDHFPLPHCPREL